MAEYDDSSEDERAAESLMALEIRAEQRAKLAIMVGAFFKDFGSENAEYCFAHTCSPTAAKYARSEMETLKLISAVRSSHGYSMTEQSRAAYQQDWQAITDAEKYFLEQRAMSIRTRDLTTYLRHFCEHLVDFALFVSLFDGYGPEVLTGKSFAEAVFDDVLFPSVLDELKDTRKVFVFQKHMGQKDE